MYSISHFNVWNDNYTSIIVVRVSLVNNIDNFKMCVKNCTKLFLALTSPPVPARPATPVPDSFA